MEQIKAYKPTTNSISSGQVLSKPYTWQQTQLIVKEMADLLAYDLVERGVVTDQVTLTIGYDAENLSDPVRAAAFAGSTTKDHYGRNVPKHAHGTETLAQYTSSGKQIVAAMTKIFNRVTDPSLSVRRVTLCANRILPTEKAPVKHEEMQLEMFSDITSCEAIRQQERDSAEAERRLQKAVLSMKHKYGKNILLKGMNLEEGATAQERNRQIGGHRA
jgi:DNA polymerase V